MFGPFINWHFGSKQAEFLFTRGTDRVYAITKLASTTFDVSTLADAWHSQSEWHFIGDWFSESGAKFNGWINEYLKTCVQ